MTEDQVQTYEYCTKYLKFIKDNKEQLPFKYQHHGCGSQQPSIEHGLERVHVEMYKGIIAAINEAEEKVKKIIEKL